MRPRLLDVRACFSRRDVSGEYEQQRAEALRFLGEDAGATPLPAGESWLGFGLVDAVYAAG